MPPKGWTRDPVTKQYKAPAKGAAARAPREFKGGVRETLDGMLTLLEPLPQARQVQAIAAAICMLDSKAAAAALSSFQLSTSTARSAAEQ